MTFKQAVYQQFLALIEQKISALQSLLNELHESAKNETKSTAGDKHETALAMLQIEQENTRNKLNEIVEQKAQLQAIPILHYTDKIIKGSLVQTNHGYFFISVAIGKIIINDTLVFAISLHSPLGRKLLGLKATESAEINGKNYRIEAIY